MRDRSKSVKSPALPPEGTNVLFDVWLVSRATSGALDQALAETGLSADEFGLYSVLTSAESLTPGEVARWMAAPPTTVSSYVKRLESRGHLERRRNPADGRSYVLRLTAQGRAAHQAAGLAFLPVLERVRAQLGAEESVVRDSLALLLGALDEGTGPSEAT